jgi:hypothetical protein
LGQEYEYTDFQGKEHLVQEIRNLEERLEQLIEQKVNLIAYSESNSSSQHQEI